MPAPAAEASVLPAFLCVEAVHKLDPPRATGAIAASTCPAVCRTPSALTCRKAAARVLDDPGAFLQSYPQRNLESSTAELLVLLAVFAMHQIENPSDKLIRKRIEHEGYYTV